jgi:hypothetical protein
MGDQIPKPGYVRCRAIHAGCDWTFEIVSEPHKIAIATIETHDGPVQIGLNRKDAIGLLRTLQLFLQDWPEDQVKS